MPGINQPCWCHVVASGFFLLFIFPHGLQNPSVSLQRKKLVFSLGCLSLRITRENTNVPVTSKPPAQARGHPPARSRPLWGDLVVSFVQYFHLLA